MSLISILRGGGCVADEEAHIFPFPNALQPQQNSALLLIRGKKSLRCSDGVLSAAVLGARDADIS